MTAKTDGRKLKTEGRESTSAPRWLSIMFIAVFSLPVAVASILHHTASARADTSDPTDSEHRRAVLRAAIADFDAAVLEQNHSSPEAQRRYRSALAGFQSLADEGVRNGYLFYNIANCHLRLGEVGRAIVHYRRALQYLPGDSYVRKNLQFARSLREVSIEPPAAGAFLESILFWHYGTSLASRIQWLMGIYALAWILAGCRLFAPHRAAWAKWPVRAAAVAALALGASVAWQTQIETTGGGALIANDVVLRKGNGEHYDPLLDRPLPEGVEFNLLERRTGTNKEEWYNVELPDGKQGWLRADQAELI